MTAPHSDITLKAIKRRLINSFREAGLESPELDTRLLITHVTDLTHLDLITTPSQSLSLKQIVDIEALAKRRLQGESLDHIFGYKEFYGRRFKVTKDVLSPRPETEMLVRAALDIIKSKPDACLLDLGTGSGAIIVSIVAEAPQTTGMAVDISLSALGIAQENALAHGVDDRVVFVDGTWLGPVKGQFDIILSNPPYITDVAMEGLSASVKDFDPAISLRGGKDGLKAYRAILSDAKNHLNPTGTIIFEIGYDQGQAVADLLEGAGFQAIRVAKDLAGHDRLVSANRPV